MTEFGNALRGFYEPPLVRLTKALNSGLERHPPPSWLDRAMTVLAWPVERLRRL